MHGAIISAEVISIFVLLILGYTEIRYYRRNELSWAFISCAILCLCGVIADIAVHVILGYYPDLEESFAYKLIAAFSFGVAYVYFGLLLRYFVILSTIREGKMYEFLRLLRYVLYTTGAIAFFTTVYMKNSAFEEYTVLAGFEFGLRVAISCVIVVITFVYIIALRKNLKKEIFFSLVATVVFLFVNELIIVPAIDVDLSYPMCALVLLLLHSLLRDSLVSLSQVEATEEALRQYESLNEMLQLSYNNMEEEHRNLEAVAALFSSMYMLDLENGVYSEVASDDRVRKYLENENSSKTIQETLWGSILHAIRNDYRDAALEFTNLYNVKERLKGRSYVSIDVVDQMNRPVSIMFVKVGKKSEDVNRLLLVTRLLEGE